MTKQEKVSLLGEAIHTGFRKGTDCKQAWPIWKLIDKMDADEWNAYLRYVLWGLTLMGFFRKPRRKATAQGKE